jgi:RNA polymerase sigma-70 factor, ECF subfamily
VTKGRPSSQVPAVSTSTSALFSRLFDEEYDFIYHSLRRLGVPSRDLEDTAHDTFVKVYENLERYDPSRPPRPWLFAFAFRLASDYRRLARHRVAPGVAPEDLAERAASAEERVADREAGRIAEAVLLTIPIDLRAVFILYEIDEMPMKTIATTLEIPVNTAYSRLRLARAAFAEAIARMKSREGGAR